MFQFMTRATKAKLRVDRHHCGHTTNPCRPPLPWWIFPQLSSETNASKEACGIPLYVWREMIQKPIKEEILLTGLESNHFTAVLWASDSAPRHITECMFWMLLKSEWKLGRVRAQQCYLHLLHGFSLSSLNLVCKTKLIWWRGCLWTCGLKVALKKWPRPFSAGSFLTVPAAGCGEVSNRLQQQAWAEGGGQLWAFFRNA